MSQSKMTVTDGVKKFEIQHVLKDVMALEKNQYHYVPDETHFNVTWKIGICVNSDCIWLDFKCEKLHGWAEWSVSTGTTMTIIKQQGEEERFSMKRVFNQNSKSYEVKYFTTQESSKYIVNGDLTVKFEVTIRKMEGIKGKLRNFNKESAEKFSDVVLVVKNEQFYINKMYLSQHSAYFEALLLGKFSESGKSEIEMKDIDSWDFQNFLEVLYGESAIDDDTVDGIVKLGDMYDAPTATRRCQEFLLEKSKRPLASKFKLAAKYKLAEVVNKCVSEMKTSVDIKNAMPDDPDEYDNWVLLELLKKSLMLNSSK